jgi:nucleotide-binding universal stress UspA family protein
MFKHILVPTDGSALSLEAVKAGVKFAQETAAKITFVTVVLPFPYSPLSGLVPDIKATYEAGSHDLAREHLAEAVKLAGNAGVPHSTKIFQSVSPYACIVQAAQDEHCDAIFMASHGRRGVSGVLLGSETQKVLTHSKLPVIVYR